MDNNTPQSNQPCRGVIVVDANELETLSSSYDPQSVIKGSPLAELGNHTDAYLDLLPLLAQRGFRIIIPEMVIKESGNRVIGINLSSFFPNSHTRWYDGEGRSGAFFTNVEQRAYPGIEAAPVTGSAPYADYVRSLRNAATLKPDERVKNISLDVRRRQQISIVHNNYKPLKKDFGEMHCFDVIEAEIKNQQKTGMKTPVFFLSADSAARDDLRQRMKDVGVEVNVLTADGIFKALEQDGYNGVMALEALGFSGMGEEHWRSIQIQDTALRKNPGYNNSKNGYFDSPLASYNTGKFPFAEAVHGMAEEIVKEQQQAAQEAKAVPKQQSAMDRFQARAAKSQQLRGGGK